MDTADPYAQKATTRWARNAIWIGVAWALAMAILGWAYATGYFIERDARRFGEGLLRSCGPGGMPDACVEGVEDLDAAALARQLEVAVGRYGGFLSIERVDARDLRKSDDITTLAVTARLAFQRDGVPARLEFVKRRGENWKMRAFKLDLPVIPET